MYLTWRIFVVTCSLTACSTGRVGGVSVEREELGHEQSFNLSDNGANLLNEIL